ncbi:MAG: hypothetical protein CL792_03490 [Chloroflexi bacterium]|nr:hypothetical protein [Chloroflexota bacterium]|tara:strand:- start:51 stop:467 length:417 start_codon:yes stop_codon:yes gene_type:complete
MKFHRSDLPGIIFAILAPAGMVLLILASYEIWDHHGTPLLGMIAGNIAAGAGILAAFSRFIEKWDAIITFLLLIAISVITVLTFQGIEYTSNPYYTLIKWVGVFGFLGFNVSVILQLLRNGLEPALNRRDERSATKDN